MRKYVIFCPNIRYPGGQIILRATRSSAINTRLRCGKNVMRSHNGYWLSKEAYDRMRKIVKEKGTIALVDAYQIRREFPYLPR